VFVQGTVWQINSFRSVGRGAGQGAGAAHRAGTGERARGDRAGARQLDEQSDSAVILLRVTPEGAGEHPVYLADNLELPAGMHPEYIGEASGSFVLGEGRYSVKFLAYDDMGRVCRREWQIDADARRSGRAIKVAMPPNTVADLSYSPPASVTPADPPVPRRLTVLLNGSAPYQSWLSAYHHRDVISPYNDTPEFYDYRAALLGILSSLLEKLPGTSVRLVVPAPARSRRAPPCLRRTAAEQRHAVRHAARRREFGQRMRRVGRPIAARFRHFHEAGAQRERRMAGEVADGQHFVAQRRHQQQIDLEKMRAISCATLRRRRSACTKSTAERKRAWRKRLGQASGTCAFSWPSRR
jgi:hypothetical protein